jgi:hypothetical protein
LVWIGLALALLLRWSRVCKLLDFRLALGEELVEGARHGEDAGWWWKIRHGTMARAERMTSLRQHRLGPSNGHSTQDAAALQALELYTKGRSEQSQTGRVLRMAVT